MMSEPEGGPEIRKSGHRLADLTVAFSAVFISLCSLGIAVHSGHTMQRLVEANSQPFVQISTSNGELQPGDTVASALNVSLGNPGAGAARIERFSILVDGMPFAEWIDALRHLLGDSSSKFGAIVYSTVAPTYLKAGSEEVVFRWRRTDANGELFDRALAAAQTRIRFEVCSCSIFDECWEKTTPAFRPTPVAECDRPPQETVR